MKDSEVITLRAHHFLCMQGFQGYGYGGGFQERMKIIVDKINSEPVLVKIIADVDDICGGCPNYSQNKCNLDANADTRINGIDNLILRKTDIKSGQVASAEHFKKTINAVFRLRLDVVGICEKCRWTDKCLFYQMLG